ncbi:MAG TPA: serine/threonine-protein kinase [Solirubrobacterales bacterium]|nr:serine/threonine-protein kinase [Solirubrobacterales bacterium]
MADGPRLIELSEGDRFAGYRIERLLGRGGMGVLYLAMEPGLERHVALKLIAPEAAADGVFARRFAEESRIAASIEHPNVVPIYAAGEEDGIPFIAMRYVAGSDLGKRIARQGRLEPPFAAALIAQVGYGLDAIHAAGLVHRDVKPANVLLAGTGGEDHAYITDFGVARNVATESGLTQTGRFVGTLDYVAPEQISGGDVDARADVYALGCLLFKLLTGEVPFPKDGEAARLYAHLNDPPPAPSLYAPEVSMALDDVVVRAMSKEPSDRYPSAGDLGRAAVAALRGERPDVPERTVATGAAATRESPAPEAPAVPASPAPPTSRPTEPATRRMGDDSAKGRRPWALAAIGVAIVAGVAAAAIALGGGGGGGSDPPAAADGDPAGEGNTRVASAKPKPRTLSEPELIAKADAICEESQRRYLEIRDLESELHTADVPYAEALARFARERVRDLRRLRPPPRLADAYREYVRAQERVYATDRLALAAARQDDVAGIEAARKQRDDEDELRQGLSREIGFDVCSASRG